MDNTALVEGSRVLAYAAQVCAEAARACEASGWAIRYTRLLRARAVRGIRGGGEQNGLTSAQVRARIRQLLDGGVLPREEPRQVVAGIGVGGRRCTACQDVLALGEVEYELTTAKVVVLVFHRRCLQLYASEALDGA